MSALAPGTAPSAPSQPSASSAPSGEGGAGSGVSEKTQAFVEAEAKFGARNYKPLDVVLARGEGVWLWDVDGNRYMDCLSAYSAVNQGHCHPVIRAALEEQAGRLTLVSRAFHDDQLAAFSEEVCRLTRSHRVLPMNSGAEAVETAIKCARKWGYLVKGVPENRAEILVCDNNFHGRTTTIISFSGSEASRGDFGPFTPGFRSVPFGDAAALEAAITPETIAFLAEPIQGEGGVVIPPDGFLRKAREICTRHRVLLMLDEIQTGLGRTGKWLAEEHEGVEADVTMLGKALGGGLLPDSRRCSPMMRCSGFCAPGSTAPPSAGTRLPPLSPGPRSRCCARRGWWRTRPVRGRAFLLGCKSSVATRSARCAGAA